MKPHTHLVIVHAEDTWSGSTSEYTHVFTSRPMQVAARFERLLKGRIVAAGQLKVTHVSVHPVEA